MRLKQAIKIIRNQAEWYGEKALQHPDQPWHAANQAACKVALVSMEAEYDVRQRMLAEGKIHTQHKDEFMQLLDAELLKLDR